MAREWHTVACLVTLRDEFNQLSPKRDKGADGTIGDIAHAKGGVSDHLPDEVTPALRGKDADNDNEVHALDIDATGPWPKGTDLATYVDYIVDEHRYGRDNRLLYVIYRGRIASAAHGWIWRDRADLGHYDHAHFSALYTSKTEADTRPYGLAALAAAAAKPTSSKPVPAKPTPPKEATVPDDLVTITDAVARRIGKPAGTKLELALLVEYALIYAADAKAAAERVEKLLDPAVAAKAAAAVKKA